MVGANNGVNNQSSVITAYHSGITHYIKQTAEQVPPVQRQWTSFVSQRSVRAVAITPYARELWLATWGGVIAWDQSEKIYRRYQSEHGLGSNACACICIDRQGNPWVGHVEGGVSFFDIQKQCWRYYSHLQTIAIRQLCADPSQGIWAAGTNTVYYIPSIDEKPTPILSEEKRDTGVIEAHAMIGSGDSILLGNAWGLFRLQMNSAPEPVAAKKLTMCTALVQDRNDAVWIGAPEGLYHFIHGELYGPSKPPGVYEMHFYALVVTIDAIWALTAQGLFRIIDNEWLHVQFPQSPQKPTCIAADSDDSSVWIGTDHFSTERHISSGAPLMSVNFEYSEQPEWGNWLSYAENDSLNNMGRCIAEQPVNNAICIGTAGGLVTIDAQDTATIETGSEDVQALAFTEGPGEMWMLSQSREIKRWHTATQAVFVDPQPQGLPLALAVGYDQSCYMLTGNEIFSFDYAKRRVISNSITPTNSVCFAETLDGIWWAGTQHGVFRLRTGSHTWEMAGEYSGPGAAFIRALKVIQGQLWVASETGLWRYDTPSSSWHSLYAKTDEDDDQLRDIRTFAASAQNNKLWLARKRSLVLYDVQNQQQIEEYTFANSGLSSYRITAIAEIHHMVWIVTQVGISRLTLPEEGNINER